MNDECMHGCIMIGCKIGVDAYMWCQLRAWFLILLCNFSGDFYGFIPVVGSDNSAYKEVHRFSLYLFHPPPSCCIRIIFHRPIVLVRQASGPTDLVSSYITYSRILASPPPFPDHDVLLSRLAVKARQRVRPPVVVNHSPRGSRLTFNS